MHVRCYCPYLFFCLIFQAHLAVYPCSLKSTTCTSGLVYRQEKCVPCPPKTYWLMKQGRAQCERCTEVCSGQRHLKQVKACTNSSNRECHCDAGFFCASPAQYTCRRCLPCPPGTFSGTPSRNRFCRSHSKCISADMAVVIEGTATHDQVCGSTTTRPGDIIQGNRTKNVR
ncbi:tumor necrosis factor receptor superfamily member 6B-like [Paramormyrops kingsleyae]|uniref:tumor necrosis factor receptor superfamily member 6B-like n=1 Tax=Paramormyrops kingsleyae TaxID=1676925 RepID=UPI000CD66712|nr:tumor necrosis factor receptor superfamily member 6B-like [Paramormyrops kingsleyae]